MKEGLLTFTIIQRQEQVSVMNVERGIHAAVFILLLVGLCAVTGWANFRYIENEYILKIAGVSLSWGIILLALYVVFGKLSWRWRDKLA